MSYRHLCAKLYLKAETQQVDRILDEFSRRYWDNNPGGVYGSASELIYKSGDEWCLMLQKAWSMPFLIHYYCLTLIYTLLNWRPGCRGVNSSATHSLPFRCKSSLPGLARRRLWISLMTTAAASEAQALMVPQQLRPVPRGALALPVGRAFLEMHSRPLPPLHPPLLSPHLRIQIAVLHPYNFPLVAKTKFAVPACPLWFMDEIGKVKWKLF
jgi:hypothetical protein